MAPLPQGIKGLTDTIRIPRAGRIRLGEKDVSQKTGREYPRALDHFNFVDAPLAGEYYGDNCRELDIMFPVNDPSAILDLAYIRWGTGGWKCRGDGEVAVHREVDHEIECLGEDCQAFIEGDCKRQGRVEFILYKVPGGLSVYDISTTGKRSIQNLVAGLEMVQGLFGRIHGIPLKLFLDPYQVSYVDDNGKQHKSNHYCLRLDTAQSLTEVTPLALGGAKLELPSAPEELPDDLWPKSVQEEKELPEAPVAAAPPIDPDILTGFEILGTPEKERTRLLQKYEGYPDKLKQYLSARVDAEIDPESNQESNQESNVTELPQPAPKSERKAYF